MEKPVIILGARGLGKVALDILQKNNIMVYGFLDDDKELHGTEVNLIPVLGSIEDTNYWELIGKKCAACVAVEQSNRQQQLVAMLQAQRKAMPINVIHPSTMIATSVSLGQGNIVNTGVSLGVDAKLGSHCLVHTHASIEHDAIIHDFVQLGAGSIVGAGATIHAKVFVGAGATIVAGAEIGEGASIGMGAVVLTNVEPGAAVLGNPAKPVQVK